MERDVQPVWRPGGGALRAVSVVGGHCDRAAAAARPKAPRYMIVLKYDNRTGTSLVGEYPCWSSNERRDVVIWNSHIEDKSDPIGLSY